MDLNRLNEKQREAAMQIDGPLLILAGAGSGKTSTMTYRIANMVDQGIDPYNILAVTFTNKAANEMRERVEALCGEENTRGMWIMTFHAMCLRMLRRDAEIIGYDKNFVIYDTTDQKTIVKNIIKDMGLSPKEYKEAYLLSVISDKKEKAISAEDFAKAVGSDRRAQVLAAVYKAYEKRLQENMAMDFNSIIVDIYQLTRKGIEI